MLAEMWRRNFPMADEDCFLLINEIAIAYENNTVSAESCMDEISFIVKERLRGKKERFDCMLNEVGDD